MSTSFNSTFNSTNSTPKNLSVAAQKNSTSSTISSKISQVLHSESNLKPDEIQLLELAHSAGVPFDPQVFKHILELLRSGCDPIVLANIVRDIAENSPFAN